MVNTLIGMWENTCITHLVIVTINQEEHVNDKQTITVNNTSLFIYYSEINTLRTVIDDTSQQVDVRPNWTIESRFRGPNKGTVYY